MYILQICLDVVVLSNELLRNYSAFAAHIHIHTHIYNVLFVIFFIHNNIRYAIFINT